MSEIKNYELNVVQKSKDFIISNFEHLVSQDVEITVLVNFTTFLISLIESRIDGYGNTELFQAFFKSYPLRVATKPFNFSDEHVKSCNTSILSISKDCGALPELNLKGFLRRTRHSFAHQHINPINVDGEWNAIRVWNINPNDGKINFILEIDSKTFFDFYIGLADAHINSL